MNIKACFARTLVIPVLLISPTLIHANGQWEPGRKLNGDNIMLSYLLSDETSKGQTGSVARFEGGDPVILHVKLYRFD